MPPPNVGHQLDGRPQARWAPVRGPGPERPESHEVATVPLGGVQRGVGGTEHLLERRGAAEVEHDPDRGGQPADGERAVGGRDSDDELGDARPDPLGDALELPAPGRGQRQIAQQHHELLAAEPADDVALAHLRPQRRGDRDQHVVPGEVAVGVVDRLEVVEVEDEAPRTRALRRCAAQGALGLLVPARGVEQAVLPSVAARCSNWRAMSARCSTTSGRSTSRRARVEHHRHRGQRPQERVAISRAMSSTWPSRWRTGPSRPGAPGALAARSPRSPGCC